MVSGIVLGALALASVAAGRPAGQLDQRQELLGSDAFSYLSSVNGNPSSASTPDGEDFTLFHDSVVAPSAVEYGLDALKTGPIALVFTTTATPAPATTTLTLTTTQTVLLALADANHVALDPLDVIVESLQPSSQTADSTTGSPGSSTLGAPVVPNSGILAGASAPSASAGSTNGSSGSNGTFGGTQFGVSYAPYKADNGCKSSEQIADDFSRFQGQYSLVRIYGTDCDQVPAVYAAAKDIGVKLFLGIWDIDQVADEASKIAEGVNGDWDLVKAVSVGNELVNNGDASSQDVIGAISQARTALRNAGYNGPVVTVDTFNAAEANPELCEESDFCAVNAHAFFDGSTTADEAGDWLLNTVEKVKAALSQPMQVVVTETGWPTEGETNGRAQPGLQNQKTAIQSIKQAFSGHPGDVILFSAFNDLWKHSNENQFAAEKYWGIDGAISNSDR